MQVAPQAEFSPLAPEVLADPYPTYRRLRETAPVTWDPGLSSWLLTRHGDCVRALKDYETFASDWRRAGQETPSALLSVQTLDPPDHDPVRRLLLDAFQHQDLRALGQAIDAHVTSQITALDDEFDLVADFAAPFASWVIAEFLGVPEPDRAWFVEVSETLVRGMDSGLVPEAYEPSLKAREELSALAHSWLSGDIEVRPSGVVGYIAANSATYGVDPLVTGNAIRALLHAGYESSGRFISNAIAALLDLPEKLKAIDGFPIDRVVDELARYDGPVQAESRATVTETVIGDQTINAGDVLIILVGAANRDPEVFDSPEDLNLGRRPNPHLGFGRGIHSCLGAGLATLEARSVVTTLRRLTPNLSKTAPGERRPNATLRGWATLPVAKGGRD